MAYYPFNSGNFLADVSGRLGPLTASSSAPTSQAAGPWANAYSALLVQASSQYFTVPSVTIPDPFTICQWFSIGTLSSRSWNRLFEFSTASLTNSIILGIYNAGNDLGLAFMNGGTTIYNGNPVVGVMQDSNVWKHVCLALSGTRVLIWVNGNLAANSTLLSSTKTSVQLTQNYLGKSSWSADPYWGGAFDEFRIYNRLLTNAEVSAIYNFTGDTTTPVMPLPCPAGTFSLSGATACTACTTGTF
ncbi:MAG: LamG domain-containing protein, partial [Rhodoferax sp.]|nr:LamG domain-containing protein [Rhodoferax sp.]